MVTLSGQGGFWLRTVRLGHRRPIPDGNAERPNVALDTRRHRAGRGLRMLPASRSWS